MIRPQVVISEAQVDDCMRLNREKQIELGCPLSQSVAQDGRLCVHWSSGPSSSVVYLGADRTIEEEEREMCKSL